MKIGSYMIRTFHPIGQGAFYSERFEEFTVIYDCGSATSITLVEKEIRRTFPENHLINAVFISHFHGDHVNGLEFLLNYCNVGSIFLPLLNDGEKVQLLIHNAIQETDNTFIRNLILNPIETLNEFDCNVYFISPIDENQENQEIEDVIVTIEDNNQTTGNLPLGKIKILSNKIPDWVFIPFNFQRTERRQKLKEELTKRNIIIDNINDFNSIWNNSQQKEALILAYKKIPGDFNTNSMTLYSGLDEHRPYFEKYAGRRMLGYYFDHYFPTVQGCLYLGDYDAKGPLKWGSLYSKYKDYWNSIGVIQIPHHGSSHNYNKEINKIHPVISIISAGKLNRHDHPDSSTIKNIVLDGGIPIIISEDPKTGIKYRVNRR